jgi:hypothetical protein
VRASRTTTSQQETDTTRRSPKVRVHGNMGRDFKPACSVFGSLVSGLGPETKEPSLCKFTVTKSKFRAPCNQLVSKFETDCAGSQHKTCPCLPATLQRRGLIRIADCLHVYDDAVIVQTSVGCSWCSIAVVWALYGRFMGRSVGFQYVSHKVPINSLETTHTTFVANKPAS